MQAPAWAQLSRGDMRSLVADSLHYIVNGDGREELYHIGDDPWEERNLLPSWDGTAAVDSFRARVPAPARPSSRTLLLRRDDHVVRIP